MHIKNSIEAIRFKRLLYLFLIQFFLIPFLFSCKTNYNFKLKNRQTHTEVFSVDSMHAPISDPWSLEISKPYKAVIDARLNEILAYSEKAMTKQQPEGLLNNFVADLILKKAKEYYKPEDESKNIDLCLLNYGGLRSSLPKGAVTLMNIYELMPFENKLTVLTLNGSNTKKLFDYIAIKNGMLLSGAVMGIKNEKAVFVIINNQALDTSRNYKVVTIDYLAEGGDEMYFFTNCLKREDLNYKTRDVIVEFLKEETAKGKTISSSLDKRIYYAK